MTYNQEYAIGIKNAITEIHKCDSEADTAWNTFMQGLSESTSSIELLKYKLGLCLERCKERRLQSNIKGEDNDCTVSEVKSTKSICNNEIRRIKIEELNKKLKQSISRSSLSIKRSFLSFGNIISQHEMIFLPYLEQRSYYNQLEEIAKNQCLENDSKLSYARALKDLEVLSQDIFKTQLKTDELEEMKQTLSPQTSIND